jgi:hypothetical protein
MTRLADKRRGRGAGCVPAARIVIVVTLMAEHARMQAAGDTRGCRISSTQQVGCQDRGWRGPKRGLRDAFSLQQATAADDLKTRQARGRIVPSFETFPALA